MSKLLGVCAQALAAIAVSTAGCAAEASSNSATIRYEYVALNQVRTPSPYTAFWPFALRDGAVYGHLCDATCNASAFAIYKNGRVRRLYKVPGNAFGGPVNATGVIGGGVIDSLEPFRIHAALFHPDGRIEAVPRQPDETQAWVFSLNDAGVALVDSSTDSSEKFVLYAHKKASVVDFGSLSPVRFPDSVGNRLDNKGVIVGTTGDAFVDDRGFRFDVGRKKAEILKPYPGDPTENLAWALSVNNRGHVLGYSFLAGPKYHERIGYWDSDKTFRTVLVQTDVSNRLLFNNKDEIVVTRFSTSKKSYLIRRPYEQLELTKLVINLPTGETLDWLYEIDDDGNIRGTGSSGADFLLRRVPAGATSPTPVSSTRRYPAPIAAYWQRIRMQNRR